MIESFSSKPLISMSLYGIANEESLVNTKDMFPNNFNFFWDSFSIFFFDGKMDLGTTLVSINSHSENNLNLPFPP